ncbi:lipopolysaccharide assembly LapA domain-containing protein [Nitrosospira sp. Nsp14]|uniref:LapA family protein n=1 Tax=Nitrosospira sp. Nsp14 TaxID=1855333 RepID=UPI0021099102|nr:LapA family protein [Nitrosospira sp. Nsp14]
MDAHTRITPAGYPHEKRIMRYLMWFLRIALFLVLLGFTVKNAETVTVHYYFGYEWQGPLILIILLSFAIGLAIGVMSCLGKILRQKREIAIGRKKYQLPEEGG